MTTYLSILDVLESDLCVGTALLNIYPKSGMIKDARHVFEKLVKRDAVAWTLMIGAYAKSGNGDQAFKLFLDMQEEGLEPDALTYLSILNACATAGGLNWVRKVHSQAFDAGLESDVRVVSALVNMYAKCGSIYYSRELFHKIVKHDVISWTVMIVALANYGHGEEALHLFQQMKLDGVRPNEVTFVGVLTACSHAAGLVDEGWRHFESMSKEYGMEPTIVHYNCMVDILGRAGLLDEAEMLINTMPLEPDVTTWGALLGACKSRSNVEVAERAAEKCLTLEPGSAGVYVMLVNIYVALV